MCSLQCGSCTRPRRLFAHLHHNNRQWMARCAFCEWKTSNRELALLDAFRLWPPFLDDVLRCLVVGFLCIEGSVAKIQC